MFLFEVDGCTNYTVLREADRAQGNTMNHSLCDDGLVTGWYRFKGADGDRMADKCVPRYRCGTEYPGWLDGSHPTVAEGVVTRKVCHHNWGDCCSWREIIKVKNCRSFYVYELYRTFRCPMRYCGNEGAGEFLS